jgi:beta-lactamase class A
MLKKTIPMYYIAVALVLGALIPSYLLLKKSNSSRTEENKSAAQQCSEYNIARLTGYKHIKPLVSAETACESRKYAGVKQDLERAIKEYKKQGLLTSASVYVRDFKKGEWTLVGEGEQFAPGSLIKVPILMAYLRMAEVTPSILDKKMRLASPIANLPSQVFKGKSIEIGKEYSVKELLHYMIADSDNSATVLLTSSMEFEVFRKMFVDLGLQEPKPVDNDFKITAKEYSMFMKALYNASYLNIQNSEYALSMLSQSEFKEGILKNLPSSLSVAHKFGEAGNVNEHQLHESGIIYLDGNNYMITVMTKGKELKSLSDVLGGISRLVYDDMRNLGKTL